LVYNRGKKKWKGQRFGGVPYSSEGGGKGPGTKKVVQKRKKKYNPRACNPNWGPINEKQKKDEGVEKISIGGEFTRGGGESS